MGLIGAGEMHEALHLGEIRMNDNQIMDIQQIASHIHIIREQRVMLDSDLAGLYCVQTKILNKAVSRNKDRFPEDFMFKLTNQEVAALRFQFGTSTNARGGRRYLPYAFTEQGIAMLSSVLRSKKAVQVNIEIMRAFVQMRRVFFSQKEGLDKLADLEAIQKIHGHLLHEHNENIAIIFEAIRRLEDLSDEDKRKIGFMR